MLKVHLNDKINKEALIEFQLKYSIKKSRLSENEDIIQAHNHMNQGEIDKNLITTKIVYYNNSEIEEFVKKKGNYFSDNKSMCLSNDRYNKKKIN